MSRGRRAAPVAGAALSVLTFYVLTYPIHGYRIGIGSDTPVYTWWSRYTGAVGLGGLGTGPRAGVVGPLAALATVLHVPHDALTAVLGPVLAVAMALAAGAFVRAGVGRDRGRMAVTVVLTGTFLALLVPGYLSTLAFGTVFVASLATLAVGLDDRGWLPIAGAAVLLSVAGLSHVLFLGPAAVILTGGLIALIRPSRQSVAAGGSWAESPLGQAVTACLGGAILLTAGLSVEGALVQTLTGRSEGPVTARDTLLRRTGLSALVRTSYRRKLLHDFTWYRALVVVGSALVPFAWLGPRRGVDPAPGDRPTSRSLFLGVIAAWLVLTAGGVAALLAGLSSPGQRLAAFCVPLPLLTAVGLTSLVRRRRGKAGAMARALLMLAILGYGGIAWLAWNKEGPLEPPAGVAEAGAAGAALATQQAGTPLILVIDDYSDKPSLYLVRALNYLRAAVPGERVPDVHLFVGTARDFLAGHPTLTGRAEHDAVAASFWQEVAGVRTHHALAVSIQAFDPHRFPRTAAIPGTVRIAAGVVALPGYSARCDPGCGLTGPTEGGPFSPWMPVWVAPILLGVLALVGLGWSAAVLGARRDLALALSPAFGLAALAVAALVVDAVGFRLDGPGGWVAFAVALGGGLAAARSRLSPDRRGPGRPEGPEPLPQVPPLR